MLPDKLPTLTKPGEVLTEEEWEHYLSAVKNMTVRLAMKRPEL